VSRITDGELRGVHTDGKAAHACRGVIPDQSTLAPRVDVSLAIQCEWTCRNDRPAPQRLMNAGFDAGGHGINGVQQLVPRD
jgi:hypothetical protein